MARLIRHGWQSLALATLLPLLGAPARAQGPATQPTPPGDDFAFSLYRQLAASPQSATPDLCFSPASVRCALSMAYAGAVGRTADQIAAVVHLPDPAAAGFGGDGPNLQMANALWYEQSLLLRPDFVATLDARFAAALQPADFSHADEARHIINHWVEQQTHDRIQNLLPPGAVTARTRLILTNAIYFKADWETPFDLAETYPEPFWTAGVKSTPVPMMHHQFWQLAYAQDAVAQAVQLAYAHSDVVMTLLLPRSRVGAADLAKLFDGPEVESLVRALSPTNVSLTMPRFTARTEVRLKPALAAMGISDAFNLARADFSGMTAAGAAVHFFIDDVYHKAFVNVDEAGTEAAAATGATMVAMAMARQPPPTPVIADHPFLYLLRDAKTGSILFLGTLTDPSR